MQAYLIDPVAETVTVVEVTNDYKEIYKQISVSIFAMVEINRRGDVVYIDDEGALKSGNRTFKIGEQTLFGKGLVLGTTRSGDSKSAIVSLEELQSMVKFERTESTGDFEPTREGIADHPFLGRVPAIIGGAAIVKSI